jgi:hypothetical protein
MAVHIQEFLTHNHLSDNNFMSSSQHFPAFFLGLRKKSKGTVTLVVMGSIE